MKPAFFLVMMPLLILFSSPIIKASDDPLKALLNQSELVVLGKISSEPVGMSDEFGVVYYYVDFKVQDVLKGDVKLKDQAMKVNITRNEIDKKDQHPLIKKDEECILFLKAENLGTIPHWATSNMWLGVQQPSPALARVLKKQAAENEKAMNPVEKKITSPEKR